MPGVESRLPEVRSNGGDVNAGRLRFLERDHYGAILVDPPWHFTTYSAKGRDRCPDARHYKTMSREAIEAPPVLELAAPDCVLFLWSICCMLPQALDLGARWGFAYKTVAFYWAKTTKDQMSFPIGTGYWTRSNPEQCLLFTRGKPQRLSASVPKLIVAPRREHSRKPDEVRERIERLVDGPYLELLARESRPGWTTWGNEATKFDDPAYDGDGDSAGSIKVGFEAIKERMAQDGMRCTPKGSNGGSAP